MSSINLVSPTTYTTAVLIGDAGSVAGFAADSPPTMTKVGALTVNAALEIQSTNGALLIPRMTSTQRDALTTVVDGMLIFNSTTTAFNLRVGGTWSVIAPGVGPVTGPVASTDNAIARWNGTGGNVLQDSVVIIADDAGTAALPTIAWTGDLDTGYWHSAANTLDVSTNGLRAFQFAPAPAVSVDYLVVTPSATNGNAFTATTQPTVTPAGTNTLIDVGIAGKGAASGLALLPSSTASSGLARFWNGAGTFYTSLLAGANAANLALTLPIADASTTTATSQVPMSTDSAGTLTFSNLLQRYATGTLSAANINAMNGAAVQLLAAPGAGLMTVIHHLVLEAVFGSAAFVNGGTLYLQYGAGAAGASAATPITGIPAAFLSTFAANQSYSTYGQITAANAVATNAAIYITNATQAFITGTGCSVRWYCYYSIVPVT